MADEPTPDPSRTQLRFSKAAKFWAGVGGILVVVGWVKTINLLLLLGYVLITLLVVNAWCAWRAARRLIARRRPTIAVFPGETVVVATEVSNTSRAGVTALVTDAAAENRAGWLFAPLAGEASAEVEARWIFHARGCHTVGPMRADSSYPFGLVHAVRDIGPPGEVLVLPAVGQLDLPAFRRWLIRGGAGDSQSRRLARRSAPGYGDVRGIKPYRPGDSLRDVHWKTSARRNQLLVREYDRTELLDLVLVVDPWLPPNPTPEDERRLEWALSLAMTLGFAWSSADSASELVLVVPGDPATVKFGRATPAFVRHAFACLARVTGATAVPPPPPGVLRRRTNRSARLVVSPRPGSPVAADFRDGGVPVAAADAVAPPGWFSPPPALAR